MNVEFHYYITHWLAIKSGFSKIDAEILATASQYVDSAIVSYKVETPKGSYTTRATQNYGFWDNEVMKDIYIPFHFLPGDEEKAVLRIDGKKNPLSVSENSNCAKDILIEALKTKNLYRIGIAAHSFVDTWAHQNFSGAKEDWNMIDDTIPIPPVGHAHALKLPDGLSVIWSDPRLDPWYSLIDNRARFLQAAKKLYKYFCLYNRREADNADFIIAELSILLGTPNEYHREERVERICKDQGLQHFSRKDFLRVSGIYDDEGSDETPFMGFDRLLWAKSEIMKRFGRSGSHKVKGTIDFFSSPLYQFSEAAFEHAAYAAKVITQ